MTSTNMDAPRSAELTPSAPATINLGGTGNQQFGHVGTINYILPPQATLPAQSPPMAGSAPMRQDQYHLFVDYSADFKQPSFIVPVNRALTEGTTKPNQERYANLANEVLSELCQFPAIFANENRRYAETDEDQMAYFGYIRDIRPYETGIEIHHTPLCQFPQQRLNELALDLAIEGHLYANELGRTHWALKRINVVQVLSNAGINVLAPSPATSGQQL